MEQRAAMAFLVMAVILSACDPKPVTSAKLTSVQVATVELSEFGNSVSLTGEIQPRFQSDLGFRVAGKIVARPADVGKVVKKGDLLARLDDQDQQNALRSAKADLDASQAKLAQTKVAAQRQKDLLGKGFTTKVRYDLEERNYRAAQAESDAAKANLKLAQDGVSYTELRADRDGTITETSAEVGQVVSAGQVVVRLAQSGEKEAVFQVSGNRLHLASDITAVEIALVNDPAVVTRGRIREISPGVDPVTRTYTIRVSLPNAPAVMRLGASVIGSVNFPGEPAISLPSSALFGTNENGPALWVVDRVDNTVSLKPVTILRYDPGRIIVSGGLAANDLVVIGGGQKLWPGQKVSISQAGT